MLLIFQRTIYTPSCYGSLERSDGTGQIKTCRETGCEPRQLRTRLPWVNTNPAVFSRDARRQVTSDLRCAMYPCEALVLNYID